MRGTVNAFLEGSNPSNIFNVNLYVLVERMP